MNSMEGYMTENLDLLYLTKMSILELNLIDR